MTLLNCKKLLLFFTSFIALNSTAQEEEEKFFSLKKTYTGSHFAFTNFNADGINRFVVGFNDMWASSISTGFHQYDGSELGQTFTTSGFRLVWGKKDMQWTASSDYAFGAGKDKNEVSFSNGAAQKLVLRSNCNQINQSFGVVFNEGKLWLEGLYCTNLGKMIIEYSTLQPDKTESFGTEYKLNGLYVGTLKTMQFGAQVSYRHKKFVFYTRALVPVAVLGPNKAERGFKDEQSSQPDPTDFPSNYDTYLNDPQGHISRLENLQTTDFKGFSYGFGIFYLIGKNK